MKNRAESLMGEKLIKLLENNGKDISSISFENLIHYSSLKFDSTFVCRIKIRGAKHYLSFKSRYAQNFIDAGFYFWQTKTETDFIRIDIDSHFDVNALTDILLFIYEDSIPEEAPFGCCSEYMKCSDLLKCVKKDLYMMKACQYKKNLDKGLVFYGANRNVHKSL